MPGILGMYENPAGGKELDERLRAEIMNEVIDQVNHEFQSSILQSPTEVERQRIREKVEGLVTSALRKRACRPASGEEAHLSEELTRRILGLGFLDLLLPPARTDLSEITIYSSGMLQVMKKGSVRW
jgi:pilus assembly protein CpaF